MRIPHLGDGLDGLVVTMTSKGRETRTCRITGVSGDTPPQV